MIKILFFIETLKAGGAEKVMIDLVNHMNQKEFDITVQTVWPCDASKTLAPGIRYKSMYTSESKVNHLRYRVEAEIGMAYRLHIKDNYDIECAYIEMGPTKVLSASTNKKAKKLAWVHCDLSMKSADVYGYVKKARKRYAKFDEVICVSESVRESYIKLFGNTTPSTVIHNVVDDEAIQKKAVMPLPDNLRKLRFTLVSLGRLAREKGFDLLLEVHNNLIKDGFQYDLWIAGEGEERQKLEQFISDHNLEEYVKLLGFLENPYPVLSIADLLICSSRYEGLSTFVTEGLILGKPIVTTDCTGMRELLGDSEYGLITEMTEESLREGICQIIQNDAYRMELARKAAIRGKDFSREVLIRNTEDYFMKVLGK